MSCPATRGRHPDPGEGAQKKACKGSCSRVVTCHQRATGSSSRRPPAALNGKAQRNAGGQLHRGKGAAASLKALSLIGSVAAVDPRGPERNPDALRLRPLGPKAPPLTAQVAPVPSPSSASALSSPPPSLYSDLPPVLPSLMDMWTC